MDTTLTDFRRNFSVARAAADRGETITIKCGSIVYYFSRSSGKPERPFADLEPLFGAVRRIPNGKTNHEIIRQRLKTRRAN